MRAEETKAGQLESLRKEQRVCLLWKSHIHGCAQATSGLFFARIRPGSEENIKPELDLEGEEGRGSLCELSSFIQGQ